MSIRSIILSYKNVINIHKYLGHLTLIGFVKKAVIRRRMYKPQWILKLTQCIIPSLGGLFQVIQCLVKLAQKRWLNRPWKPSGWWMYTFSWSFPFRKVLLMSIYCTLHPLHTTILNMILKVKKCEKRPTLAICWNPIATNLALNLSTDPSLLCFTLKIHLVEMMFIYEVWGTKTQVLFLIRAAYSSVIDCFHSRMAKAWETESVPSRDNRN